MTSMLGKDDIEDALMRAGIVSPYIRQRLMTLIEQYARKYPVPEPYEDAPPVSFSSPPDPKYKYTCPACKERKLLSGFPERKAESRRSPVKCLECEP